VPNFSAAPAQLVIAGGTATFVPARFSATPAQLRIVGGTARFTIGAVANDSVTTPKLDRIMRQELIVEKSLNASQRFQLIWQRTMEAIEDAFGGQQGQITDLANIVARLEATEAKADAAVAQSASTAADDALAKSYPSPSTILSATSDGTITISAHTRVYGDGTSVSVNGGSVSGWPQGQFVQIYYDDAGRAGGAVAYQGTTEVIAQAGARHIVGGVPIPLSGEPPVEGEPPYPSGYVPDTRGMN
jgi:hypothetical protein